MKTIYLLLLIYLSLCFHILAQKEKGRYFIRNFTPKEYQGHTQNWAAVQDDRGMMYIGNTNGVLEYDGKNWRLIPMPNRTTVRTIVKGKDGVIYLGSQGDFGFLKPNAQGMTEFISLKSKLPAEEQNFKDIWTSHAGDDGIYFMTDYKIYRLNPDGSFSYFTPSSDAFFLSFYVNGNLYVHESKIGLSVWKNGKFQLIKGGEKFKGLPFYTLISREDGSLVAGAGKGGLFLIDERKPDDQAVQVWNIPVNAALQEGILYCGMKVANRLVFGTLRSGVYVLDEMTGELLAHLHQDVGLQNNQVWNVGADNQGGVWVCTNKGLSRVELGTPFTFWTEKEGAGKIFAVAQQNDQLYIATGQGVMMLNKAKNVFEFISKETRQAWSFLNYSTSQQTSILLAGTQSGVYIVKEASLEHIKGTMGGFFLHVPKKFSDIVMIATLEGVNVIRYYEKDKKWELVGKIDNYTEETRSIADDPDGNIWLGSYYRGVFQLVYSDTTSLLKPKIIAYDTTHALPSMKENYTFNIGNKLIFSTISGIYEFDKEKQKFFPSNILGEHIKGGKWRETRILAKEEERYVWYRAGHSLGKTQLYSNEVDTTVFMRLPLMEFNAVYPEKSGEFVWIGSSEGLFKYHRRLSFMRPRPVPLVRRFNLGDSTVFWGSFSAGTDSIGTIRTTLHQPEHIRWTFPYALASRSLQWQFAAASFDSEEANQYRYFLEGNDKMWSDWTSETKKEYTNLWEGDYVFRLKARNVYGVESDEIVYRFKILPPWYRTVWAYLSYLILAGLFTYGMVKLNTVRLERANKRLEEIVNQRTAEIKEKNIILEQQKEEIMVQNEELHQQQEEIIAQRDYIEKQKEQLQEQHTRIVDSIRYAQTIQQGVLPFEERLQNALKEYFVLYKPKDIVSGDFYWFEQVGDRRLFAVVDCTGHGVPGAFMSMIGIAILNDIVIKEGETQPKNILEGLNRLVRRVLKQDEEGSNQDGMDVALVAWEAKETVKVLFAGAKRPLYYLKNGKIEEIKGVQKSIGGQQLKAREFVQEEIDVLPETVLYLFTDGYTDQSIGAGNARIGTTKFKELLEGSHDRPLAEQKTILESFLIQQQGDNPQRDDITLVAIRV